MDHIGIYLKWNADNVTHHNLAIVQAYHNGTIDDGYQAAVKVQEHFSWEESFSNLSSLLL
eukprot:1181174-Prorocentrum_minimum.AAC.2